MTIKLAAVEVVQHSSAAAIAAQRAEDAADASDDAITGIA